MSRRSISPVKPRGLTQNQLPPGFDQRDNIINKLKQQLIMARSKEKQVLLLENYMVELKQKMRILNEQVRRKDLDYKNKTEQGQKSINMLKKDIENFKNQLKNSTVQLGQHEATLLQLKRHLAKRNTELQKLKKQTLFLKDQIDRLLYQNATFMNRHDQINSELIRINSTIRDNEDKLSQLNVKLGQVRAHIGDLNNQTRILKDQLKKYQQENNNYSDHLNNREDKIDELQRIFADEHDLIKVQIDNFIELEHRNEKTLTEARHKINLVKAENQKTLQLNNAIQKVDKAIASVSRQNQLVQDQVRKLEQDNIQYNNYNLQLKNDLNKCEIHLQNLIKYNTMIQQQLEKSLREDEQIISLLRRKRAIDMVPLRESRKITQRTTAYK